MGQRSVLLLPRDHHAERVQQALLWAIGQHFLQIPTQLQEAFRQEPGGFSEWMHTHREVHRIVSRMDAAFRAGWDGEGCPITGGSTEPS